jgi:hypothetical protein
VKRGWTESGVDIDQQGGVYGLSDSLNFDSEIAQIADSKIGDA